MLLGLRLQYKDLTGEDLAGGGGRGRNGGKGTKEEAGASAKGDTHEESPAETSSMPEMMDVPRQGLEVLKEENIADWYSQVVTQAEMIEYYDVSGCYMLRPWSFSIWENISTWLGAKMKSIGFQDCYLPIFASKAALQKVAEQVEGYAPPHVAWVTKSGDSELAEPISLRHTSEHLMFPAFAKWVRSHRDLPIKLNQWCNAVRWESKHRQPFLRTREFLWQEGYSSFGTSAEAKEEVHWITDRYEELYEKMLAIPVVKGKKTRREHFAGAEYTSTVEAYVSATGRGIQAATCHYCGQTFSKMFDISFEDPDTHEKCYTYDNSFGFTTRSIGVMIMVHGDNKGLKLPPRIAVYQAVIVPSGADIVEQCRDVEKQLTDSGIRVKGDYRDSYSPGWKADHWQLKGVPLLIEIGVRDIQQKQMVLVRRDNAEKVTLPWEGAAQKVKDILETIQQGMFDKAKKELSENTILSQDFDHFCDSLNQKKLLLSPFCGGIPCEENISKLSARGAVEEEGALALAAKSLCIPFNQPGEITADMKCIGPGCTKKPLKFTLFGRSY